MGSFDSFTGGGASFSLCGEYPDGFTIPPLLLESLSGLTVGCIGTPFELDLRASGGVPPYTWTVSGVTTSITPTNSPSFNQALLQAGSPCPGAGTATVRVTDAQNNSTILDVAVEGVFGGGGNVINLVISSNTQDYVIRDKALLTGWNGTSSALVTVTVNSGVYVRASTILTTAIATGASWAAGSTISLINNGFIQGHGGNGGTANFSGFEASGAVGGNAIKLDYAIFIDNTFGYILGGGNGGNSGIYNSTQCDCNKAGCNEDFILGGGGGGGAGNGIGGSGFFNGANGTAALTVGAFGVGTISPSKTGICGLLVGFGGHPGSDWGVNGKAVNKNGFTCTITGGCNSVQIKGAVS